MRLLIAVLLLMAVVPLSAQDPVDYAVEIHDNGGSSDSRDRRVIHSRVHYLFLVSANRELQPPVTLELNVPETSSKCGRRWRRALGRTSPACRRRRHA